MRYLSPKEVAQLLGKSSKWVYKHKHKIPGYFTLAGSIFFDKEKLLKSLETLANRRI